MEEHGAQSNTFVGVINVTWSWRILLIITLTNRIEKNLYKPYPYSNVRISYQFQIQKIKCRYYEYEQVNLEM